MNRFLFLCSAAALLAAAGCKAREAAPPATAGAEGTPPAPEAVTFTTADGWEITASFWPAPAADAPAAILLHMLPADRHSYDGFGPKLAAAGFNVLAPDSRGHGESLRHGGETSRYGDFDDATYNSSVADVAAAKGFLASKGADVSKTVLVGASIGANFALNYAAGDGDVVAAALLSPGLDYHGVRTEEAMAAYRGRAVYLAASDEDNYAADSVAKLHELAPDAEFRVFSGAGHGTNMFRAEPAFEDELIAWLAARVK